MRLIDADATINRLNKAMGILYAKEIIESDIECPTVKEEKKEGE